MEHAVEIRTQGLPPELIGDLVEMGQGRGGPVASVAERLPEQLSLDELRNIALQVRGSLESDERTIKKTERNVVSWLGHYGIYTGDLDTARHASEFLMWRGPYFMLDALVLRTATRGTFKT